MKLLIYVGSPRKQGNTYKLLKKFKELLEAENINFDVVLSNNRLNPCLHCGKCSVGYCVIKDDWFDYIKNFNLYDGVVFMSPIYFFHFTSQTKAFIDRLGGSGAYGWNNKIISCITTSGSKGYLGGNSLIISSLKRTAKYHNCRYVGCYNKVTDDKILEVSSKDIKNLKKLIKKILRCYNEVNKSRK